MDCKNCINNRCFLNKYCLPDWLGYAQHQKISKFYSSDKTIFSAGDLVRGIYIVCSGKAKVLLADNLGNNKVGNNIIRIAGNGQILGHRGFSEDMIYPITAETLAESEISYLSNEDFFKLVMENKDLAFHMMMFFADELLRSEQKLSLLKYLSPIEKVVIALLSIIQAFGFSDEETKKIDLGMNFNDFASFAKISKSKLESVITSLCKDKVIDRVKGDIFLLNMPELRKLSMLEASY